MGILGRGVTAMTLVLATAPMAYTQTLGDLARQEEARRKAIARPAKVYTNDDLRNPPAPPPPAATPATPAGGAPPSTATPPSPSGAQPGQAAQAGQREGATTPKADEATWRQRVAAARDNLARSQTLQDALQSRINALTTDFANRADPAQRAVIATDRQKAVSELDRVKQEIQQYQKEVTNIQEEARKAGVPAGWVR